jgi:hypothetical protein
VDEPQGASRHGRLRSTGSSAAHAGFVAGPGLRGSRTQRPTSARGTTPFALTSLPRVEYRCSVGASGTARSPRGDS